MARVTRKRARRGEGLELRWIVTFVRNGSFRSFDDEYTAWQYFRTHVSIQLAKHAPGLTLDVVMVDECGFVLKEKRLDHWYPGET